MSIASAIATKQQQVADSYTAVSNKGGTLPTTQNLTNLATAISSIPSGGYTPTLITKNITQNGTYNASSDNADGYSSVIVNVSGSFIGIPREVENGVYRKPISNHTFNFPSDAIDVGSSAFFYAFDNDIGLTSVNFTTLQRITGSTAFYYAFTYTGLTTVSFPMLSIISSYQAMYRAFANCSNLTTVSFPMLSSISGYQALGGLVYSCPNIKDIYFNALTTSSFGGGNTNQFQAMLNGTGTSVTHTLHFPSNMESTILGLTGYPNFSGTSGYVVLSFDLPATS